jgi:hypothetical protein
MHHGKALTANDKRTSGACEGERVLYALVITGAAGARSIAGADYDDLELMRAL